MANQLYDIDEIIKALKQQGDEIKLQLHLAKAEARDEWPILEKKLEALKSKAETIRHEAGGASEDIIAATKLVADEVKHGFERLRKLL